MLNNPPTRTFESNDRKIGPYSFNIGNNSLYLINIDQKYKILLCACKSYVPGTKNGILMILMAINKKNLTTFTPKFYPTEEFEVNCFYTIYELEECNHFYILAGGFEIEKRRGMVKLYRLSCNIASQSVEMQFIQDSIEDFDEDFDGMINNIIKYRDKSIKITCSTGKNYLFSLPENDNIFKFYEELF